MLEWWQTFPLGIDRVAFSFFGIPVAWYTLCYLFGVSVASVLFVRSVRRLSPDYTTDAAWDVVVMTVWGVVIGARLGYVLIYGGENFWLEPWQVISPYDPVSGEWTGIRGLSFHGGLVGGAVFFWMVLRKKQWPFWTLADSLVVVLPLALLFGRIGNFLNHEILGRITTLPWGMYLVPGETLLRHPVTLYEALGEGLGLFGLLWWSKRWTVRPGERVALFFLAYASVRFLLEYFREPMVGQFLWVFSSGQWLSLMMGLTGASLWIFVRLKANRQ